MPPIEIDLSTAAFSADPYPIYRQLQQTNAPYWWAHGGTTGGMWMFSRYEDVAAILKEARISKNVSLLLPPEMVTPLEKAMLFQDPPDHTRLRALASQTFTPARVRDMEPRITRIVDDLLAQNASADGMDFIADFALPLPVIVIAELLGVPHEDRARFQGWSKHIINGVDMIQATEEDARNYQEAMQALVTYFADLSRERRAQPREDIISALINAQDTDAGSARLSEEELIGTCILLLIAGHETTINLLGNGLFTLLRHPEQLALVQEQPELITSSVEEMLRFESPVQRATFRFTREAFMIKGVEIAQWQQISAVLGAANRDPTQFPDPDRFDVTRDPNRHLGFGLGIHFCLGAALARTEARIGFTRLLKTLPNMRLALQTPEWNASTFFRGLKTLPITF